MYVALMNWLTNEQIHAIDSKSGHLGIQHMTYLVQSICPAVTKAMVRLAIWNCDECCMMDPALIQWKNSKLGVDKNWWQLGLDVTHYDGNHFLSLMDSGPTGFTVQHPLVQQDALSVIQQLRIIFCEYSPPDEILTDNTSTFCDWDFQDLAAEWGVRVRYRGVHTLEDNGIAEQYHCSVKRLAARIWCSIQKAMYCTTPLLEMM